MLGGKHKKPEMANNWAVALMACCWERTHCSGALLQNVAFCCSCHAKNTQMCDGKRPTANHSTNPAPTANCGIQFGKLTSAMFLPLPVSKKHVTLLGLVATQESASMPVVPKVLLFSATLKAKHSFPSHSISVACSQQEVTCWPMTAALLTFVGAFEMRKHPSCENERSLSNSAASCFAITLHLTLHPSFLRRLVLPSIHADPTTLLAHGVCC